GRAMVTFELGESRRVKHEYVPNAVLGMRRVLRALGILQEDVAPPTSASRAFTGVAPVHVSRGGGLRLSVDLAEEVAEGQTVGQIVDVFGKPVERLVSPRAGFVLRVMKLANVATGAEAVWIGY